MEIERRSNLMYSLIELTAIASLLKLCSVAVFTFYTS